MDGLPFNSLCLKIYSGMEMIVAQLPEVTAQQDREIEWLAELLGAYCLYEKKQYGDI